MSPDSWSDVTINNTIEDIGDLISYVDHLETEKKELESRLRWKKIAEEKPRFDVPVQIKNYLGKVKIASLYQTVNYDILAWDTGTGFMLLSDYPEWREI
jgi:hypothetical protein